MASPFISRLWICPLFENFANADLPASNFVRDVDFTDFQPLASPSNLEALGGTVGNDKMVLGWNRDTTTEPPDWNLKLKISKQTVNINVPGTAVNWQVDFYNTKTETDIISSSMVTRTGDKITIILPDFMDDIAFKLYSK
jgi:hypothetical protein